MKEVRVWEEKVVIPTYEVGKPEKNPIFLDKRVYQGSSGKVYPYPTIETISDEKVDKEYTALYLENEYLKIMILPELGGRIQRAYDKTNDYDFVYYNHVIKPALVGLTGPWISGGIEFNWPQHHRPTTFLPVDYQMIEQEDGSKSVLCHDVDQMYGTKGIAKFTLYPGKAYLEVTGQLYNRTPLPQTFLWWANPAVPVNDYTQSIFPPDVHAVMDHGKRDVSRFPIATGVYYKQDYSEGVDISRYKNIPVPTSYMAEKSKYDFVGGYDYQKEAGILHVADHHVSPGKKQWTWGCGDFGKAWDRNLTDEDGPYVELMTGMFTDNQPDFTWLKPFEEKTFRQYFMPYKKIGAVKNASEDMALHMDTKEEGVFLQVYGTSEQEVEICLFYDGKQVFEERTRISPVNIWEKEICGDWQIKTKLTVEIKKNGRVALRYTPEKEEIAKLPDPAEAIGEPEEIKTNEELYLAGLHIEQYRHATYLPDPYYLEALKRDPMDIRVNTAYGMLLLRRGCFEEAEGYFTKALERMTRRNPNPYTSEAYYQRGLARFYLERYEEAYDDFYKATWSNEQQEMSFYYLAAIDAKREEYRHGLEMVEKALIKNAHNIKARGLKAYLLRKLGENKRALAMIEENLWVDSFDYVSRLEEFFITAEEDKKDTCLSLMRDFDDNYLMIARDYAEIGGYQEALAVLESSRKASPLNLYYQAYYHEKLGCEKKADETLTFAEQMDSGYCFPNKLEDIFVLSFAIKKQASMAAYYLGNLYYDKLQWEKAVELWEMAKKGHPEFPTIYRNLSLAYYNKLEDKEAARWHMEQAFAKNTKDARVFFELDQLYKKLNLPLKERLAFYQKHLTLAYERYDACIEYITLLQMAGKYQEAKERIQSKVFHPWEGGEGKITTQYALNLWQLAKQAMEKQDWSLAEKYLRESLVYPENLGEGKLEGTKDNHILYTLGEVLMQQNRQEEAKTCFLQATLGTDEPAGAMFYNDQPADMIYFQGRAFEKLGKTAQAKSRYYRLIDYGEAHVYDQVKIAYFAVSLPDFLIFDEDYTRKNQAHCYYLMGLGHWGLGDRKKAKEYFSKVLELEPYHQFCALYSKELQEEK